MGIDSRLFKAYGVVIVPTALPQDVQTHLCSLLDAGKSFIEFDGYVSGSEGTCCFIPAEEPEDLFVNVDRRPLVINSELCQNLMEAGGPFRTGEIPEEMWKTQDILTMKEEYTLLDRIECHDCDLPQMMALARQHDDSEYWKQGYPVIMNPSSARDLLRRRFVTIEQVLRSCYEHCVSRSQREQEPLSDGECASLRALLSSPSGLIVGGWLVYFNC